MVCSGDQIDGVADGNTDGFIFGGYEYMLFTVLGVAGRMINPPLLAIKSKYALEYLAIIGLDDNHWLA